MKTNNPLKLFRETFQNIKGQLKKELEDDVEIDDEIFEENGKWFIKVTRNLGCNLEEYSRMRERGITKHMLRGDRWINVKEVAEILELGIPKNALNVIKIENASSVHELEELKLRLPKEDELLRFLEEKLKELSRYPIVENGWEDTKTPAILPLGKGEGSLLVVDSKGICLACGRFSLSRRQSYVWAGTKDKELLELGYGSSVKHYWTSCNKCNYEYVS